MRKITKIILHCSASSLPDQDVGLITQWHKKRGFRTIGYHWFIKSDGIVEPGRSELEMGAHCTGHNGTSIGICLAGLKLSDFTKSQWFSLARLLSRVYERYPEAGLYAHNELDTTGKTCPVFDIIPWREFWRSGCGTLIPGLLTDEKN